MCEINNAKRYVAQTEQMQIMHKQNNTPDELINEITETLNIITKQNYFTYNNKYYTQNDGLPMGSPISLSLIHI